jgi:4-amino-4-deoxy-L-arabinose transferase-like glycosyltransferase
MTAKPHRRGLLVIVIGGALLRLAMALYLGNHVEPTPAAYDQVHYHDVALNLLAGRGFVFTRPPWPFIRPGVPTAYVSFLYQLFLAGVYAIFGPHPMAVRIVEALICSLMPWQVYGLMRRILAQPPPWGRRASDVALVAAGITAAYAYFVYFSATIMTEGLYLVMVVWALTATLILAENPSGWRWAVWGLAVGMNTVMRQVFMPMAGLLFLYVLWRVGRRVRARDVMLAGAVVVVLILPWTVRNYLVFDRFLLLNSQSGQVFWNANHPSLGVHFEDAAMFAVPSDLRGANEADLSSALMRRGLEAVAADPWRFVRLSWSRVGTYFRFWPSASSPVASNIARIVSFAACLPFMASGLCLSLREWRRWSLLYLFTVAYTFIHVISWAQIRYRMPVDVALVPFAALAVVVLGSRLRSGNASEQSIIVAEERA